MTTAEVVLLVIIGCFGFFGLAGLQHIQGELREVTSLLEEIRDKLCGDSYDDPDFDEP